MSPSLPPGTPRPRPTLSPVQAGGTMPGLNEYDDEGPESLQASRQTRPRSGVPGSRVRGGRSRTPVLYSIEEAVDASGHAAGGLRRRPGSRRRVSDEPSDLTLVDAYRSGD